jgi:hypothetical protein
MGTLFHTISQQIFSATTPLSKSNCCPLLSVPRMGAMLKKDRFQSAEEMKEATMLRVKEIPGKGLQECFQQWYDHCQKHVTTEGNWFESTVQ